jgi:hypothetical protein
MIAVDLLAFAQTPLLHDTGLARVELNPLRNRLLHVAARLIRGKRRLWLRIDQQCPWIPRSPRRSPPHRATHRDRLTQTRRLRQPQEHPAEQHAGHLVTSKQRQLLSRDQQS